MNDSFILPSKLPPTADAEFSKTSKIPAENKHVFYGSPANTCVRFTKTSKTPLMMSVAFGPTSCSSGLMPKSKLLQRPESHDGFVPKHCHHGGKNHALRAK